MTTSNAAGLGGDNHHVVRVCGRRLHYMNAKNAEVEAAETAVAEIISLKNEMTKVK